jgi:electron transfer DM13
MMASALPTPRAGSATPIVLRLLAIPLVVAILLAGLWFWSAVVARNYWVSIGFGVAWFVVASIAFGRVTKRRRDLRLPMRATFAVTALAVVALFYWTSVRTTTVHERVATGTPASQLQPAAAAGAPAPRNVEVEHGKVESLAHDGRGTAAVVRLASGPRVLTLTSFAISPGPQVEVRLVTGTDPRGNTFETLGGLKGDRGNQQYRIPAGLDLGRYGLVVFWCVPFNQALAKAQLNPA